MTTKDQILLLLKDSSSDDIFQIADSIIKLGLQKKKEQDDTLLKEKRQALIKKIVDKASDDIEACIQYEYSNIDAWQECEINKYEIELDETGAEMWGKFCDNDECSNKNEHYVPQEGFVYYQSILNLGWCLCDTCIGDKDCYPKLEIKSLLEEIDSYKEV